MKVFGLWLRALLIAMLCSLPAVGFADQAERDYAEGVVSALYYEGIPYDTAAAITPDGASRLLEMLSDPEERPHHGNILVCLGISGYSGSYEALLAYLESLRERSVERPEFRSWRIVPVAMGHLARKDPRALRWLIAQLQNPTDEEWTFLRHDLSSLRRRGAILGLGVSGVPAGANALNRYAQHSLARSGVQSAASNSALNREIGVALDLNQRVASAGPGSIGAGKAAQ